MKTYGIYLFYAPTVDMRHQGLGRQLAAMLKAGALRPDIRFLVACPSWARESLEALCESEGVPAGSFDVLSPPGPPAALYLYNAWVAHQARRRGRASVVQRLTAIAERVAQWVRSKLEAGVATSRSVPALAAVIAVAGLAALVAAPLRACWLMARWCARRVRGLAGMAALRGRLAGLVAQPKSEPLATRLYRMMQAREAQLLVDLINRQPGVRAWYCPTAFWPSFNAIRAPRLMCVPDVVLTEFPVAFSAVGGERFLENFRDVEAAIAGAGYFVTYSEHTKWRTLVDRYGVPEANVRAIAHAPIDLSGWISASGFPDLAAVRRHRCEGLLRSAMARARTDYAAGFSNPGMRFIFYASQFRPSKNVLTLLRAYEHMLRKRLLPHKLVLTGDPDAMKEIADFIGAHRLGKDVLCLHGLSVPELAACYSLAELAVNPSLSEGGCPFTFSEALSVGTPAVMARIPVTEETLDDPALSGMMFFDPYDWRDLAVKVEWALANRGQLLQTQLEAYRKLATRTWTDVVDEHVRALEHVIACEAVEGAGR
ncbi:MAG: glycosyltransferase [Pseudomonadota bacterium]